MTRLPLSKGDVLQLNEQPYTIEAVIGAGATCIVYSAYYLDSLSHAHRVNIKECYPFNAQIERDQKCLNWNIEGERAQFTASFRIAYEKLMIWQNESFAVNVFDLCEANNTLYLIMTADKGKTFDVDNPQSLHDIFNTVKLLTHFIGKYHENGYLHLDVKPSNFLVYPRPSEHIILFDMDTVTPVADINAGKVKRVSYSEDWAAPEQKQGRTDKLCPATDLFSIGAILFEKIMGRSVSAPDMGMFADWDFDSALFENVNPKIKCLLRDIFRKTLSANVKRRYQCADELISGLQQACAITSEGTPYLSGNCPPVTSAFIGRQDELEQIDSAFSRKKRAIFLHGEAGIGKSQLALAYADRYQNNYDAILFLRYKDSLEELIDGIEIQNCDITNTGHRKVLRKLLDEHVLLIIDNFDVAVDQEDLEELFKLKAKILFTTRTDFSKVYSGSVLQIDIEQLPENELIQLFVQTSGYTISENKWPYLHKMFNNVAHNTYAVELLGLQLAASGCTLESLFQKVIDGFDRLSVSEKVRVQKDGRIIKRTIPEIIRALYNIAELNDDHKQVLRNMYLLRFINLDRTTYSRFTNVEAVGMDALNDMLELGWVRHNGYGDFQFTLHPLVEELVRNDLHPNHANCQGIYTTISNRIRYCCEFDDIGEAADYEYDNTCEFLCTFFNKVPLTDKYNLELLLNWLTGTLENEYVFIGSPIHYCFTKLYQNMISLADSKAITTFEEMQIRYIVLAAWVREFGVIYGGHDEHTQQLNTRRQNMLEESFAQAVCAAKLLASDEQENALDHIYGLLFDNAWLFSTHEMPEEFILQRYSERPQACALTAQQKKQAGLPLSSEDLEEIRKFEEAHSEFAPDYADFNIAEEHAYTKNFLEVDDKIAYISQIANDESMSPLKRAQLIWYCTNMIFQPFHWEHLPSKTRKTALDWSLMEQILDIEEELLISDELKCESYSDHMDWRMYMDYNAANQAIVYAALGEIKAYEGIMDCIFDAIGRDITFHLEQGSHWSHFTSLRDFDNRSLWYVLNGLTQIQKASWILPYLIRFADGWRSYATNIGDPDEKPFFAIYKAIAECAENTYCETDTPSQYQQDFLDIELRYRELMDEMTGNTYTLRISEE